MKLDFNQPSGLFYVLCMYVAVKNKRPKMKGQRSA